MIIIGYMTITVTEAYNTAIELLKGTSKSKLVFTTHTGGYVCPGEGLTSHEKDNKGKTESCKIKISNFMKIHQIRKDYKELEEFYKDPASEDTISSEEARKQKKDLCAHIEKYVKPEHLFYEDHVEQQKVAEEL